MADRHAPHHLRGGTHAGAALGRPRGGGPPPASAAAAPSAGSGVRRNLFQSQLTRRPTSGSASASSAAAVAAGGGAGLVGAGLGTDPAPGDESGDIVVRDRNGEVALEDPPPPMVDDPDEVVLDARLENEKERRRLADAVKHHQINQNSIPAQPEELLEAVRLSLRAKVAALAEDDWMFEGGDDLRHQ